MPSVLAIRHFRPDIVHIAVSDVMESLGTHEVLRTAIDACADSQTVQWCFHYENAAGISASVDTAREFFTSIRAEYANDDWTVLLNGGTKPLAIGLYESFSNIHSAHLIYMELDDPDTFIDQRTGRSEDCCISLTVNDFLNACGLRAKIGPPPTETDVQNARYWMRSVVAGYPPGVSPKKAGENLEVFLWGVLNHFASRANFSDVQRSAEIAVDVCLPSGAIETVCNEIDVLVAFRNRLIAFECKTGLPAIYEGSGRGLEPSIASPTVRWNSVEYKLAAQAVLLGERGVKTVVVLSNTPRDRFVIAAVARAKVLNIGLLGRDDLARLEDAWSNDDVVPVIEILSECLS